MLVSGKCINELSCKRYSYYLATNISTQWTPANCKCLDGYFMSNYVSCDTICHFSCKTCNTAGCLTC